MGLYVVIMGLYLVIHGYMGLYVVICGYMELYVVICGYVWLSMECVNHLPGYESNAVMVTPTFEHADEQERNQL